MKQLIETTIKKLNEGNNVILCTIIASSGSTPRGAGAKMVVASDSSVFGTIGGGNVEYQSILLAKEALQTGSTFIKNFELNVMQNATLNMVCGGKVDIYFQYFSCKDSKAIEFFDYLLKLFELGEEAWLIFKLFEGKVNQIGAYTKADGLRLLSSEELISSSKVNDCYNPSANDKFSIFDKQYDGINQNDILPLLSNKVVLNELCSPNSYLYIEPLVKNEKVFVFGGGHVARELVPVITHVGFNVTVYEDRPDFATKELFKDAAKLVTAPFTEIFSNIKITPNDYVIVMTRGHQADYEILKQIMKVKTSYIGVIGSKKKKEFTFNKLQEDGFSKEELAKIHMPIGLSIGASTPAEIAISIASELIEHRAKINN